MNGIIVGTTPTMPFTSDKGLASGIDTFTVTFTVLATDDIETPHTHAVKVVVNPDTTDNDPINNHDGQQ